VERIATPPERGAHLDPAAEAQVTHVGRRTSGGALGLMLMRWILFAKLVNACQPH
jgi:hypothetical protein